MKKNGIFYLVNDLIQKDINAINFRQLSTELKSNEILKEQCNPSNRLNVLQNNGSYFCRRPLYKKPLVRK